MLGNHSGVRGIGLATLAAGPIFVAANAAAGLYLQLPKPIVVYPSEVLLFVAILIPASVFGCILSVVPNLIGSGALITLGNAVPEARAPEVWTAVGAIIGILVAAATGAFDSPPLGFALVTTSAACARICRRSVVWA